MRADLPRLPTSDRDVSVPDLAENVFNVLFRIEFLLYLEVERALFFSAFRTSPASCPAAQLALAWVLARGDDIVPIPGSRRLEAVEENIGAINILLTASEIAEIDSNLPAAKGERYGAPMMAALDT